MIELTHKIKLFRSVLLTNGTSTSKFMDHLLEEISIGKSKADICGQLVRSSKISGYINFTDQEFELFEDLLDYSRKYLESEGLGSYDEDLVK